MKGFSLAILTLIVNGIGYAHAEGFGSQTPGGNNQSIYYVTNLNDSGSGSLRAAVSAGNRNVKFQVSGTIRLSSVLRINGSFITVDGSSAPSNGITLTGAGVELNGIHDVIVKHIRIRDIASAEDDGMTIWNGSYNILVDHVSISRATDGALDITEGSHDVTVQYSLLEETLNGGKATLIKYNQAHNISIHHVAYIKNQERMPLVTGCYDDVQVFCTEVSGTTLDFRNNIVSDWTSSASWVDYGAHVNFVNNYYTSPSSSSFKQTYRAITVDASTSAKAYVAGNISGNAVTANINSASVVSQTQPYNFSSITPQDACTAAFDTRANAGAQPRDSIDAAYVATISLNCVPSTLPPTPVSLKNPGFEEGLTIWNFSGGTKLVSNVNSGTHALRITGEGSASQVVDSIPSKAYTMKFSAKLGAASPTSCYAGIDFLDASGRVVAQVNKLITGTSYKSFSITGTAPSSATRAKIWIWNDVGSSRCFSDDYQYSQ